MTNPETADPLLSGNKARVVLAIRKGVKKIDQATLNRLVREEGLPKHYDPFGSGRWCFLESELVAWWNSRMAGGHQPKPIRGPGRPRKVA